MTLLTGGGLVGLGGFVNGWLANRHAAKRDEQRYEHEQAMAAETRRQERLEEAYIELLGYLSRQWAWARSVRPFWGQFSAPEPLPQEERWRIEALVTAYGSQEVARLLEEWGKRAAAIEAADATIRDAESPNPSQQADDEARQTLKAMAGHKDAMQKADRAIRDQVRRELAGEV